MARANVGGRKQEALYIDPESSGRLCVTPPLMCYGVQQPEWLVCLIIVNPTPETGRGVGTTPGGKSNDGG